MNVSQIRAIGLEDISLCVSVIWESFSTVAKELGLTAQNAPRFTAFAVTEERLRRQLLQEKRPMYGFFQDGALAGFYSLFLQEEGCSCELNNLCVLPARRHQRVGEELLAHSLETAKRLGYKKMHLGIVEENQILRRWYEAHGFRYTDPKRFDFFPFTCGYIERCL